MKSASETQTWTIRQSPCGHQAPSTTQDIRQSREECEICGRGASLSFESALQRLHSRQTGGSCGLPSRLFEDPCIVWLEGSKSIPDWRLLSRFLDDLRGFKLDLEELRKEYWGLHHFFSRPGPPAHNDGIRPPRTGAQSTQERTSELPALPASLLTSFQQLMALFVCQSQLMLQRTRANDDPHYFQDHKHTAGKWHARYWSNRRKAMESIRKAQEVMVLNITESNAAAIRLGAVGPELIAIVAMMNVQRESIRVRNNIEPSLMNGGGIMDGITKGMATWSWRGDPEKAEEQAHTGTIAPLSTSTFVDIIGLYSAHLSKLRFSASVNPQRRVFMDIRALKKELSALYRVNHLQMLSLWHMQKVIDPNSFRITNEERQTRFPLEKNALEHGVRKKTADSEEVKRLLGLTDDLALEVKSDIEVLDEGHGNAIRVFTIVTFFFLPL